MQVIEHAKGPTSGVTTLMAISDVEQSSSKDLLNKPLNRAIVIGVGSTAIYFLLFKKPIKAVWWGAVVTGIALLDDRLTNFLK